jgi:L-malate glycosyltransferase
LRIALYNQPSGPQPGGSEYLLAVLGDGLARTGTVDFLHHNPELTRDKLQAFTGASLDAVSFRAIPRDPGRDGTSRLPWVHYAQSRAWYRHISQPYDIFINCTHTTPPFCASVLGVLLVLFPFDAAPHTALRPPPWKIDQHLRRTYLAWEWNRRMSTYAVKISISDFTRHWVRERWRIDSTVVPPPVDSDAIEQLKQPLILSVGRFAAGRHSKRQLEMARAFTDLVRDGLCGWKYVSLGGVSETPADLAYMREVESAASGTPMIVQCNVTRQHLREQYARAMVFWHGAGFGDAPELPELAEHFGISTVEAMAAGCVPIVINRGGQREIVEHGVNGFLWNTLDDLKKFTLIVAGDEGLRKRMSAAAKMRAQDFSRERFLGRFMEVLTPALHSISSGHRR